MQVNLRQLKTDLAQLLSQLAVPTEISEQALIHQLQQSPYQSLPQLDLQQSLELFQCHFILYHLLYQLRLDWLKQEKAIINIGLAKVGLVRYQTGQRDSIAAQDPLAAYYLNFDNFNQTAEKDVDLLLDNFFKQLKRPVNVSERQYIAAVKVLGSRPGQSLAEHKKAYLKSALKHHPDRKGETKEHQNITQAWQVIQDYLKT
ncbi:DNA-J related domain-containing protein [Gayadomonas joobiniege]|uniref:DNA-J related domain-containing protein n=1 Tax=Gayadomonas joobiniege TaxID=1234606 RepID=UPI00036D4E34|nr:DNA-J related domain-containing protein [Gayadomonas joobiniege]